MSFASLALASAFSVVSALMMSTGTGQRKYGKEEIQAYSSLLYIIVGAGIIEALASHQQNLQTNNQPNVVK